MDQLIYMMQTDDDYDVRIAATNALARFEEKAGRAAVRVVPLLGSRHWPVRVAAARALGRRGQPSAVDALLARIRDPARPARQVTSASPRCSSA